MSNELDNVTSFEDRNIERFGGERREKKAPYRFQIGDSPIFSIEEPDSDTVMDIEEAKTSRSILKLFLGDQYTEVADYLGPEHPDTLVDVIRAMSQHFGIFDADAAINRSQRRSRDRRRNGRR